MAGGQRRRVRATRTASTREHATRSSVRRRPGRSGRVRDSESSQWEGQSWNEADRDPLTAICRCVGGDTAGLLRRSPTPSELALAYAKAEA